VRGHAGLPAEPEPWPASKMENLIEEEPLLITSMCTPPSDRPTYMFTLHPSHIGQMNSTCYGSAEKGDRRGKIA
jgi:hypothetical protein